MIPVFQQRPSRPAPSISTSRVVDEVQSGLVKGSGIVRPDRSLGIDWGHFIFIAVESTTEAEAEAEAVAET